jgi:hypothetical protein
VVGRAPALLTPPRAAAFGALALGLGLYYAFHDSLWNASTWADTAVIALVLMPAVFGLVLLALPLSRAKPLQQFLLAAAFGILAAVLQVAGVEALSNFAKLGAMTMLGFWFLNWFESVQWIVLVACIIPWVDAYSVFFGPTKTITEKHGHVFTTLSVAFPVPGEDAAANLGLPDLMFFALFLSAAARFGLRVYWTWLALVLSFGTTMALAILTDENGLPALPLLAIAFLAANADLLWRQLRSARRAEAQPAE